MDIYIYNLFSIFLIYLFFRSCFYRYRYDIDSLNSKSIRKKVDFAFLLVFGIQLVLIAGLRDVSVGTDTKTYYAIFDQVQTWSFRILPRFYVEIGYAVLNKIVGMLGGTYTVLLLINQIIIILGIFKFVYRTSENVLMSVFLFVAMGYFSSTMNVMRQFIALSFVLSAYYHYGWKKQTGKSIIMILLGSLFHSSSIVIIPILFLHYILYESSFKKSFGFKFLSIIAGCAAILLMDYFVIWLSRVGIKSITSLTEGVGVELQIISVSLLIKICISMLYFYEKRIGLFTNEELKHMNFLNFLNIVSCFMSVAGGLYPLFSRFNIYFQLTTIVFLPTLVRVVPIQQKRFVKIAVYIMFGFLFMYELPGKDIIPWTISLH